MTDEREDDVREALVNVLFDVLHVSLSGTEEMADAILSRFDVTPKRQDEGPSVQDHFAATALALGLSPSETLEGLEKLDRFAAERDVTPKGQAPADVEQKARAEAEEGWPFGHEDQRVRDIRSGARDGFVAGAVWQASQPVTDEQVRAALAEWYRGLIADSSHEPRMRAAIEAAREALR